MSSEPHLSPIEAARRLGVTVKALKVYEQHGLVAPLRSRNGWRVYGPAQLLRLHEALALKALGLRLAQIAALMDGRTADLDRVLALQEVALRARWTAAGEALRAIARARRRLAAGETLTIAELAAFNPAPEGDQGPQIMALYRQRLGDEAVARLRPGDRVVWAGLMSELRELMAVGADPKSPRSGDFFRRWLQASEAVSGGDADLHQRAYAAWMDGLADPDIARRLPLTRVEVDYLIEVAAASTN